MEFKLNGFEYRIIPGHEQYAVSRCGKSVIRVIGGRVYNRELAQYFCATPGKEWPNGYMLTTLLTRVKVNKLGEMLYDYPCYLPTRVHRGVCMAWKGLPPTPGHKWVNHKDGDKLNNDSDNLEWMTPSENRQHAFDVLGHVVPKGKEHWNYGVKASEETKLKMRYSKLGEKHPKFKGWYIIEGRRFASSYEAGEALGIQPKTIYRRCLRSDNGWDEYSFERKKIESSFLKK